MRLDVAVTSGSSGNGNGASGAGVPDGTSASLVVVYPDARSLLGKRVEVPWHGFRIGGEGADFVVPSGDGTAAEITRSPGRPSDEDHWRILQVSGKVKVNGEALDGSHELKTRDRIEIAGMGFVFLCGVTWESQYHEIIYQLTITDLETGWHNARYFREALEREEIRSKRHQVPLSVAVLDFGSSAEQTSPGQWIRDAADRLGAALRRDWVLARLSEYELGVIAPETTEGPLLAAVETPFQHSKWSVHGEPLSRPRIGTASLSLEVAAPQLVSTARAAAT